MNFFKNSNIEEKILVNLSSMSREQDKVIAYIFSPEKRDAENRLFDKLCDLERKIELLIEKAKM